MLGPSNNFFFDFGLDPMLQTFEMHDSSTTRTKTGTNEKIIFIKYFID